MSDVFKKTGRCYLIDHHSPQPPIVPLGKMEIGEYKDFFRESEIDSLMVYCKDHWGVTYYDSKVEGAQKHKGVEGDWIRTVRDATAEMGIEFVAYYCIEYDEGAARKFPEWRVRKADGTPLIRDDLYAKWSIMCYQTGYREYCLRQLEEIVANYHPDSLFLDIFGASLCYCDTCKKQFQSMYGYALPETSEGLLEHQMDVKKSLQDKADDFYDELQRRLKAIDPSIAITINFACHYPKKLRSKLDYQYSEPLMKDNWYSSAYARDTAVGQYPMLAPGEASQVYNYDPSSQYIVDLSSIAAQGCRVGMYSGSQHVDGTLDHQEARNLGAVYGELKKLSPWLSESRKPVKSIGILQSDSSKMIPENDFLADSILRMKKKNPHVLAILGAMMACEANKVPYTVLPEDDITAEKLQGFDCLILPEVFVVTDAVQAAVRAYASAGGKVIISGRTGNTYGRAFVEEMTGTKFVTEHNEYAQNDWSAYLKADQKEEFRGLLAVTTPPVSEFFVETELVTAVRKAHFLKPAVACSPTEWINWWSPPAGEETEIPAIAVNAFENGLVAYLAYDYFTMVSREIYRDSYPFFRDLMHLLGIEPVMQNVTEHGEILRTAFFETADTYQIHQISTLPDHYRGDCLPISGGKIVTKLPLQGAKLVYPEKRELEVMQKDGIFTVELPDLTLQQFVVLKKA